MRPTQLWFSMGNLFSDINGSVLLFGRPNIFISFEKPDKVTKHKTRSF